MYIYNYKFINSISPKANTELEKENLLMLRKSARKGILTSHNQYEYYGGQAKWPMRHRNTPALFVRRRRRRKSIITKKEKQIK